MSPKCLLPDTAQQAKEQPRGGDQGDGELLTSAPSSVAGEKSLVRTAFIAVEAPKNTKKFQ